MAIAETAQSEPSFKNEDISESFINFKVSHEETGPVLSSYIITSLEMFRKSD